MNVVDLNDNAAPVTTAPPDPTDDTLPSYTPDEETKERFRNLAIVGKALMQATSENRFQTDFYLAKQGLDKFVELYNRLQLDTESKDGMDKLVEYLRKKIDRRLNASLQTTGADV